MGEWTTVTADDGHRLSAYLAPTASPAPAVVILQEIFGVTRELTGIADRFADVGFRVVIPALYDRIEPDYVLAYDESDRARAAKNQLRYDEIDVDVKASLALADTGKGLALLGYCWGGGLVYWAAQNHTVAAVVSYYGTGLSQYCRSSSTPSARCLFHVGLEDPMIDVAARNVIKASCRPVDRYFEYENAGHAFANTARPNYCKKPAALAEQRTLEFLHNVFTVDSD
ncbi:MAG: dienelactone hydrolase family protein [Pseudomonadota bacterium]